mgnify:CR=1 FL=1
MKDGRKKDLAFELYIKGKKIDEIAEQVGVSSKTIQRWAEKFKWDEEIQKRIALAKAKATNSAIQELTDQVKDSLSFVQAMVGVVSKTVSYWAVELNTNPKASADFNGNLNRALKVLDFVDKWLDIYQKVSIVAGPESTTDIPVLVLPDWLAQSLKGKK